MRHGKATRRGTADAGSHSDDKKSNRYYRDSLDIAEPAVEEPIDTSYRDFKNLANITL